MSRVSVFIDGSNFYHSCRENLGGRTDINYSSFRRSLWGLPAIWSVLTSTPALCRLTMTKTNGERNSDSSLRFSVSPTSN